MWDTFGLTNGSSRRMAQLLENQEVVTSLFGDLFADIFGKMGFGGRWRSWKWRYLLEKGGIIGLAKAE